MTFFLPERFVLIEEGECWGSERFHSMVTSSLQESFLNINYSNFKSGTNLIATMILSLLKGQKYNIPVVFNRTGQVITSQLIPERFCIGMLTSGTTGEPKLITHVLEDIIPRNTKKNGHSKWLLCYHPMSFAGLQVILQAIVCGDTLIASPFLNIQQRAQEALDAGVTALSATPSLMRSLLLTWQAKKPPLSLITCGGEICDQVTLDAIKNAFPTARLRHIYATTELGVLFTVSDGNEGFPLSYLNQHHNNWSLSINNHELYVSKDGISVGTGDGVKVHGDRVLFTGRLDNLINVGGVKVNLDKLEHALLALPTVVNARVFARKNPITGALVCAEIQSCNEEKTRLDLAQLNEQLVPAEQFRVVHFVKEITLSDTGKKQRV